MTAAMDIHRIRFLTISFKCGSSLGMLKKVPEVTAFWHEKAVFSLLNYDFDG